MGQSGAKNNSIAIGYIDSSKNRETESHKRRGITESIPRKDRVGNNNRHDGPWKK